MSKQTTLPRDAAAKEEAPTPAPARDVLDRVVARVRRDASEEPEGYLRESEVPGGGE